jgi:hypothetical protein
VVVVVVGGGGGALLCPSPPRHHHRHHPSLFLLQSLTKYYAPGANVMGGAVCLNPASPWYQLLRERLSGRVNGHSEPPLEKQQHVGGMTPLDVWRGFTPLHPLDALALDSQLPSLPAHMAAVHAHTADVFAWLQAQQLPLSADENSMTDLAALRRRLLALSDDVDSPTGMVSAVHWAYAPASAAAFRALLAPEIDSDRARDAEDALPLQRPGSLLSFELTGTGWPLPGALARRRLLQEEAGVGASPEREAAGGHLVAGDGPEADAAARAVLAAFYDACFCEGGSSSLVKGPSFGAACSTLTPFLFLAHYDLVDSVEGRAKLRSAGLNPYLLRLSVGSCAPPTDALVPALRRALLAAKRRLLELLESECQ